MSGRDKARVNDIHKNENYARDTELRTPVYIPDLGTPNSTSSLTCSPSDLTLPITEFEKLTLEPSKTSARLPSTPSMDPYANVPYDSAAYFGGPPDDLHSKRLTETPHYSKTKAMITFQSAFGASKKLQQVLGITEAEPYVRPPPMPQDLEQRFTESLQEYRVDPEVLQKNPLETLSRAASERKKMLIGAQLGKTTLEDISEEKESPVRATHRQDSYVGRPAGLTINPLAWDSGYKAVSGAETTFSNTQLNIGQSTIHDSGLDYRAANVSAGYNPPQRSSSLANLTQHMSNSSNEQHQPVAFNDTLFEPHKLDDLFQRTESPSSVLFPSPRVEHNESWGFPQTNAGTMAPQGSAFDCFVTSNDGGVQYPDQYKSSPPEVPLIVPHIMVQAPSPQRMPPPVTKKRPATSQGAPPAKARASDDTCGLPILAANLEMLWKVKFPGNTYALLTIMLPWSLSMHRLYKQIRDPYTFSINSAFPYPVKPPVYQKLISVSFYNTSVTPHKEILFLGPNDCSELSYSEVDVFSYPDDTSQPFDPHCRTEALKRALGLNFGSMVTNYKHMPMHQRAATGEGRWSYIIIQGHRTSDPAVQAPHVMIAWPTCAVTDSSECLHTIYPDAYNASHPRPFAPKRATSLQNLAATMRLQQNLRAAGSEQLPGFGEVEGALTLKRRVVKMEKAGKLPLIEGYRVDVRKWECWLKAVGMGKGKVMSWMER